MNREYEINDISLDYLNEIVKIMKFFDYTDSDSLYLSKELIMVIPLTTCVFSYSNNSYKKFNSTWGNI